MAKEKVSEIRISKRIVRIGHQSYPMANISRVQTGQVVWRGKLATFYPLWEITFWLLILVVGSVVGTALGAPPFLLGFAAILVAVRMAYLLLVLCYRVLARRWKYALVIETAGTQYTALRGTNQDEIHRIESEIISAIEDPPLHEVVLQLNGDFVMGDKVGRDKNQQIGTDHSMIIN